MQIFIDCGTTFSLIFCFSEGEENEDDERPELASASTEESVASEVEVEVLYGE